MRQFVLRIGRDPRRRALLAASPLGRGLRSSSILANLASQAACCQRGRRYSTFKCAPSQMASPAREGGTRWLRDLPETMTAMGFDDPGGPDVLRAEPCHAAGENQMFSSGSPMRGSTGPIVIQRRGFYPPPPGASPILGLEVAGDGGGHRHRAPEEMLGRRSALWFRAAAMPNIALAPWRICLAVPDGMEIKRRGGHSRDAVHRLAQCVRARLRARWRACWCTAAPAGSAPWRSCWPKRSTCR